MIESVRMSSAVAMSALALAFCPPALAMSVPGPAEPEVAAVRYLPSIGETRVAARIQPALCIAFALPQEWRREFAEDNALRLAAAAGDGIIEIVLRSVRDLKVSPHGDSIEQDAAFLQRGHENVLGRPAQATTLDAVPGATRWRATWIDGSLPSPSHTLTIETYIVPASSDWLLELSVSDIDNRETYDNLVRSVLSHLQVANSARCSNMT